MLQFMDVSIQRNIVCAILGSTLRSTLLSFLLSSFSQYHLASLSFNSQTNHGVVLSLTPPPSVTDLAEVLSLSLPLPL